MTSVQIPSGERSVTPLLQDCVDQSMWYPSAYYYGGEVAVYSWVLLGSVYRCGIFLLLAW